MIVGLHILGAGIVVLLAIGGGLLGEKVFFRRRPLNRQEAERLGRVAARSLREATKMMTESIQWNGLHVGFRVLQDGVKFVKTRQRLGEKDMCPLCKKYFQVHGTTSVVLVISNQAGVPNRFLHSECVKDKTKEYAFGLIAQDWEDAQKYKDWF